MRRRRRLQNVAPHGGVERRETWLEDIWHEAEDWSGSLSHGWLWTRILIPGEGEGIRSELFVGQVDFHPPVRRVRRALRVVGNSPRAGQADAVEARPLDAARDQGIRYSCRASKREGDGATLCAAEEFLTNSVRTLVVAADAVQPAL